MLDDEDQSTIHDHFYAQTVFVTSDGQWVYACSFFDKTVSVIDAGSQMTVTDIPVGGRPSGLAVTPDSKWVYVATGEFLPLGLRRSRRQT